MACRLTRTLFAAVLLSLGMALTGLGAACDSAQPPLPADPRLDAMIGQMIMVGFLGDNERDAGVKAVRDQLAKGTVGGVVLYPENIGSAQGAPHADGVPAQRQILDGAVHRRRSGRRQGAAADAAERPPLFSVGRRASAETRAMPRPTAPEQALCVRWRRRRRDAGFNLNFGPVVDLNLNPANPVIGQRDRSFSADPNTVTALARAFIVAHREADIVTVAKHFPGHGSSHVDSHKALADISQSWREIELEPYRALAKDGLLDAVMIGHLYHPTFSDGAKLPASLSGRAVRALRRQGISASTAWW